MSLIIGLSMLSSCDKSSEAGSDDYNLKESSLTEKGGDCSCLENAPASITPEEEEMLIYMREEEKLARDVYQALYGQYQEQIFANIANSEQRHMDRILCLLEHYGIDDPASPEPGVFSSQELQDLYNALIEQGSNSPGDALTVGATIEDVDIFDLNANLENASNDAIINVFNHLLCGSRNHMRAFSNQLALQNLGYTPQYISQDEYDQILASGHERCGNGNGHGNGQNSNCNGSGNSNNGNGGNNGNCNGSGNGGNSGNCTGNGTGGSGNGNTGNGGNGNGGNGNGGNGNGGNGNGNGGNG